jgi:copper chaperone CopZ
MKTLLTCALTGLLATLLGTQAVAETKVTLSGMHLCCGGCTNGVKKAVKGIEGVTVEVDGDNGETIVTATNDEAAQKAIDAIANAGFHATSSSETLKMKDDSGVKAGKLTRLELTGIHNCCGSCNSALKEALADIPGIEGVASKAKTDKIVIEGNFDGAAVVKAIYGAGFHGKQPQK